MTQASNQNAIKVNEAAVSVVNDVETRAENIEVGINTAIDSYRINDYVPESEFNNVNAIVNHIIDDEFVDSVNILVDGIITDDEKALDQKIKKEQNEYIELKETFTEPTHKLVIKRLQKAGVPFYSNSNISAYLSNEEREDLIDEATEAFTTVLDTLVIDHKNDPNAMDTPRRLAKMYINELMQGRYYPAPKITAFPNQHTGKETGFGGLLVVRSEIVSMCSHHHQPVKGVAYIGIIPDSQVIGLSKYTRLVQWLARRGTLQEELAEDIADGIIAATGSENVSVFIEATHGCCQNRGIMANDSTTQTTVLRGDFLTDGVLRKEFHDNIMFQKMNK